MVVCLRSAACRKKRAARDSPRSWSVGVHGSLDSPGIAKNGTSVSGSKSARFPSARLLLPGLRKQGLPGSHPYILVTP